MATISAWNPFGVSLNITATSASVTRTSATTFSVSLNVSWSVYYSGNKTNYGMSATSGGKTTVISAFGTNRSSGSGTITGTSYSISGNGAATKTITVKFTNYEEDWQGNVTDSASKTVSLSVSVPAWTSYTVTYNANGGSGAPSSQTKWKDQTLTLSSTKPTRTGYTFKGWGTSASATTVSYAAGASYTANAAITLYAIWTANTYTVAYNANGGSGAPSSQTKTYGVALTLSSTKPTRTNYTFKGWGTLASATTVSYAAGASYTANAAITLYAIWELAYTKPRITGVTVTRCSDTSGTASDSGTYACLTFKWTTDATVSSIKAAWTSSSNSGSATYSGASGTSGTVTKWVIGSAALLSTITYTITITVTDASGSTSVSKSLNTESALIHGLPDYGGIAFGKKAELDDTMDVNFQGHFRKDVTVGDKTAYLDGNQGVLLDTDGFIHLQRSSSQGYHPYLGFYIDSATTPDGSVRVNSSTKWMQFVNSSGYSFDQPVYLPNGASYQIANASGSYRSVVIWNSSNNVHFAAGSYDASEGTVYYNGNNVHIRSKSDVTFTVGSAGVNYRAYYRAGDSDAISVVNLGGYVTNNMENVCFFIPLSKTIIGSPTVTVSSTQGLVIRQGGKYTHGSAASTYVNPSSYSAAIREGGINVVATMSTTTNAINNEACGIIWTGTITFS